MEGGGEPKEREDGRKRGGEVEGGREGKREEGKRAGRRGANWQIRHRKLILYQHF